MPGTEAPVGAQEWVPPRPGSIADLKEAAAGCRGCELYEHATQTVFGRGAEHARIVFVGEQPGDVEDQRGLPFVGPAGRLLREAVDDAGIDPADLYITNAVKHFRFELRGKRRIHQTPGPAHIVACRPWVVAEFALLKPELVVLLGATAGKALLGSKFKLGESRGRPLESDLAPLVTATAHPSSILRQRDDEARHEERRMLAEDLKRVAQMLAAG